MRYNERGTQSPSGGKEQPNKVSAKLTGNKSATVGGLIAETNYLAGFFEDGEARHRLREAAQLEIARREL